MSLTLYYHPLASFCHKVLIALYEAGTPFTGEIVDLGDPEARARHLARWPLGKMPVLATGAADHHVAESSIMIEYLDVHHPGAHPMLPIDAEVRLAARLWDRLFDDYVSASVQKIVLDRLRAETDSDRQGVAQARSTLTTIYAMIEQQVATKSWAVGDDFTIADCSAAPALFYAGIVHPFPTEHAALHAYFDRLMARPSVARVIAEARPYFSLFPYNEAIPARFR